MPKSTLRAAVVQTDVFFGDPVVNARRAVEHIAQLAEQGVELAIFPEACLTGYVVSDRDSALAIAVPVKDLTMLPAPWAEIQAAIDRTGMSAVLGAAVRHEGRILNVAYILQPETSPRIYAKTHLPELGLDHYVTPGESLATFPMDGYRLGVQICYDLRFAEATRVQALEGAEVIALPTNWPKGADFASDQLPPVRANENHVFLLTANRVGTENGVPFIGKSGIYAPSGEALARAGTDAQILIADLELSQARNKVTERSVGPYRADAFGDRRPELYGQLTEPAES